MLGRAVSTLTITSTALAFMAGAAFARSPQTDANAGIQAFVDNCFSPLLTAAKAEVVFNLANLRYDFYDLDPFSNVAPSPSKGSVTAGTDRRCAVSFDHDFSTLAVQSTKDRLQSEGIVKPAKLPSSYHELPGTTLLAARQLNPRRIAVVHIGTRAGPNGTQETFMYVERLLPSDT